MDNRIGVWRVINAAVMLVAFFAPWHLVTLREPDHISYGFALYQAVAAFTQKSITFLIGSPSAVPIWLFFIGLTCILAYCALNLFVVMRQRPMQTFHRRALALLSAIILGLLVDVYSGFTDTSTLLLWGYWLTWIGVGSSIWLEATTYRERRKQERQRVENKR